MWRLRLDVLLAAPCVARSQQWSSALGDSATVAVAATPPEIQSRLRSHSFDAVVVEMDNLQGTGLELYRAAAANAVDAALILVTSNPDLESSLHAMNVTAYDSVVLPPHAPLLKHRLERLARFRQLSNQTSALQQQLLAREPGLDELAGTSAHASTLRESIAQLAQSDAAALILGEAGTGKALAAKMIHNQSPRAAGPFVPVACGRLDSTNAQSTLFGCSPGTARDSQECRGLLQIAAGGTLLLQDCARLPLDVQVNLLAAMRSSQACCVGSDHAYRIDVRWLATSGVDPWADVYQGRLHQELLDHLMRCQLRMPALREVPGDIATIAQAIIAHNGAGRGRLASEALDALGDYSWPGNVRELRNVIERATLLSDAQLLQPQHLHKPMLAHVAPAEAASGTPLQRPTLAEMESRMIQLVLRNQGGNKTAAAKILGISLRTLYNKLGARPTDGSSK